MLKASLIRRAKGNVVVNLLIVSIKQAFMISAYTQI